jgi:hypothetical protein
LILYRATAAAASKGKAIPTVDDKDLEKRYGDKLNKSGDGVNIASVKNSVEGTKKAPA